MDTIRNCQQCRKPLPQNAPEGLCPECLARVALGTEPAAPGATINVNPAAEAARSGKPEVKTDSTLTISPDAFVRVRYFGDYELLEEIARGGMGVVWKARQASLNRTVAVKMILAGKFASGAAMQRFRREAEAAANLQHPNIVAIHEVGEHDGQHYYSMDYVAGRDLGALVRENGPFPPVRAAECLKTLAEAVHFAHQRGTLHRDLKPQNVLMDAAGHARITDFGLAKFVERDDSLTETGAAMGSPSYMPPEQAAGHLDQVGPRSDVYSLGAILYELLTGRPPFRAETAVATMRRVMESDPVAPRKIDPVVPPDLETICLKCLEKNSERRYHSAQALADELGRFLNHEPIQALPVSFVRKAESWVRRHPWILMAAVSMVAMVLSGLLYWQHEQVKFLENPPLVSDQSLPASVLSVIHLESWNDFATLSNICIIFTMLIFRNSTQLKMDLRRLFAQPRHWEPARPASQRMRGVCGLISIAVIVFGVFYFAKLIRFAVWEKAPPITAWLRVYSNFYFSLALLFFLFRDYQKFVHGMPGRTLSAEQTKSLRHALRGSNTIVAVKLVRQAFPDVSLAEAGAYVGKFAREELYRQKFPGASQKAAREGSEKVYAEFIAELETKYPLVFAPPKLGDLNWRLMGLSFLGETVLFAGVWLLNPPASPAGRLLVFTAWFLSGALITLSLRLKSSWQRFLIIMLCFLLPSLLTWRFFEADASVLMGLVFGALTMVWGFTPKKRKSVPGKGSLVDAPPSR